MKGVVYGTRTDRMDDERLATRFDFDEAFGTVINRYCAQAVIGYPLMPYGLGGQQRGFIALRDSMQCLTLAAENPPDKGEYRVFNQFDEVYSVEGLAEHVKKAAKDFNIDVNIEKIENPRVEAERHYYNPDHGKLKDLGFRPTHTIGQELKIMFEDIMKHKGRIEAKKDVIKPNIMWRTGYDKKD